MESPETIAVAAPSAEVPVLSNPVSDEPSGMSDAQYNAWRLTGKTPSEAESAPAKEPSEEPAKEPESAAASEPAKPSQEPPKRGVKARNEELDRDIQDLQQKLRTRAELRKQMVDGEKDVKPDSSTAQAQASEYKPLSEEEYFAKNPTHTFTDFINAAARHEAAELRRQEKAAEVETTRKADFERQAKENKERWDKQVSDAMKEHPDLVDVIFSEAAQTRLANQENFSGLIRTSEMAPKLIHALTKNLAEFDRILAIKDPYAQAREVFKFEQSLSGKKVVAAPAAKPAIDDVPAPPRELGGRGSATKDEVEKAIEEDDTDAYMRAANRRDLQRSKGK